ncbi:phenylpropionate dioxygenase [Leptolyngbya sp. Heron Island J]|uniref:aromatic ring-hydroxylating oxygenase subunit alpha n=1 Tax=Leptolyngbya sp. Heron Island J TaxID=1385935 RepID=UPI0003B9926A|nr:aromatic ring-hydroxylating dioxygenase subunit alpha [Leptolyngbya sp. Heron Island J]ESA36454.1 phenylpropionate dioxygenase [Leptolyngbya sp. Heron Island J]
MNSPHVVSKPVSDSVSRQTSDVCLESSAVPSQDRQSGLLAAAYTSAQYLERERQTVFSQAWVCVGLASDLPNPGDVYPTDVAGISIVLVRDRIHPDSTSPPPLRAFHNICRHRGLQLVDKPCNVSGRIQCPYHSWTYRLDGTLKGTPHFGGYYQDSYSGFERDRKGLIPIRCEQWLDLVFVNLSGDAPPLTEYLKPAIERWSDYDLSLLRRESREVGLECNANWKLAVENFSESYHLSWVHPALNSCSRMEDHFGFDLGGPHVGQGSLQYKSGVVDGRSLPTFPNLESSGKQTIAEYITVFPNLMLGVHPDYFLVFLANPISPDKTAERMLFYFVGDGAMTPENQALRHLPIDLWQVTNDEDIAMIERMQIGRQSPGFDGGCFSPELEQTVYQFQQAIARAVGS